MNFPKLRPGWKRPALRVLSSRYLWIVVALALALLVALLLYQPYYFTFDDNATGYLPQHVFNYRSLLREGTVPYVNFHQYLGEAYFAMGTPEIYYLPAYLSTFFADKILGDLLTSVQVDSCLHLLLAAVAAYAYLRVLKVSSLVSAYGALLYLSLPFWLCGGKSWLVLSVCAFFIPALLACLEAFLLTGSAVYLVAQCALKIAFAYHGNLQFMLIYGLGEVIYLAFRWWPMSPRPGPRMLLSYVLTNLIWVVAALPLVIPMHLLLAESAKRATAMPLLIQVANSVLPKYWFQAQLHLFKPEIICDSNSSILYLGGSIFFLVCLYGLRSRMSRRWQPLWHLLLTTLVLSTVANVVLRALPYFDKIRWPFKWYIFVAFAYPMLAAVFLDEAQKRRLFPRVWLHCFFGFALFCNLLVTFSPISQAAFGAYHLTPEISQKPPVPLGEGRSLTYGIQEVDSYRALVEIRSFTFSTLLDEHAFGGYNSLLLQKVKLATFDINYTGVFYAQEIPPAMRAAFDQWNVRHVIAPADRNDPFVRVLEQQPGMIFQGTTESGFRLYENRQVRPYAWAESNPSQALPTTFHVNTVEVDLHGASGKVVVSLIRLAGWNYRVDAGPWQAVTQENSYGQIVVEAPPQAQQVTLRYTPPGLQQGVLYAALGLLILIPTWYVAANSPLPLTFPKTKSDRPVTMTKPVGWGLRWIFGVTLALWLFIVIHYTFHIDQTLASIGVRPATPIKVNWRLK